MKEETQLNCSIGIGSSRLIAKVSSAQAKPNGVLWIVPGEESKFLAPLDVRAIPGVGKVMESHLHVRWVSRKWETWRGWKNLNWRSDSASGGWRWRAKRAEKMPGDGSTQKWAPTLGKIHQPRAYLQRRHGGCEPA
jgi:hypothetical protein